MKIKCCGYNIVVGAKTFDENFKKIDLSKYSKIIILTEKKIYNLWKNKIDSAIKYDKIIQIESGEKMKNLATATKILKEIMEIGTDRKSLLINIGGGMIEDLGGFVASVYMRGVDYINCPTTLLAMVDASIGGKNGVNFEETKNIIGCFGHPKMVMIDVEFLATLESRELTSAYGEIIKHAIYLCENVLFFTACMLISVSKLQPLYYTRIVFASLISYFMLGEILQLKQIILAIIIVAININLIRVESRKKL